jgi:hypothetical protein
MLDRDFILQFEDAGEPDQAVIDAYIATLSRPLSPPKHQGFKRWYYFYRENHRIVLSTIGRPLSDWQGSSKVLVGTIEIIGEFESNAQHVGQTGLKLQCQPIEWMQGTADQEFANGTAMLAEISEQIFDRRVIERSQQQIKQLYKFKKI